MKTSTSRKTLIGVAGATAVIAAAVAVSMAHGDNSRSPASAAPTNAPTDLASVGLVAAKDPVTGQLTAPTAEQMRELQAAAPIRKAGPRMQEQRLANGTYVMTLDSSYEVASVAVKGADGRIKTVCVPADQVQATLDAAQKQQQTTKTNEVLDEK